MAKEGDVVVSKCMVSSPRGSLDLNHAYLSFRVYESILVQNNIVELDVLDTEDALGNLKFQGDETIELSFNAPGTPTINYIFSLDKVELIDSGNSNNNSKQYILHGVGKETMYSKSNYIQKSYNTDISSIVRDIHNTFLNSANKLITEATDGIQKIIIPNMRPFDAIDLVRRRATSMTNLSSTFLYFENAIGHNFKTIEGMLKSDVVKTFVRGNAINVSIYNNGWNNIIDYKVPKLVSSIDRISLGSLTQRVGTFDIRTRTFDYKDQKMNIGNFNSDLFRSLYGITYGLFHLIPQNSLDNKTYIEKSTPQQMAYLANITQTQITIKVYGDTTVKAGDAIQINIPQPISTTSESIPDPLISNKYLVTNLCRNVGKLGESPRYTEVLDCITDTQGQSDNNSNSGSTGDNTTTPSTESVSTPTMVQGVTHN